MLCQDSTVGEIVPGDADAGNLIALDPVDWFRATWRDLTPLVRPEPAPFDLQRCFEEVGKVRKLRNGRLWDWEEVDVPVSMTRTEAHFWLSAMTQVNPGTRARQLVAHLARQTFDGQIAATEVEGIIRRASTALSDKLLAALARFLRPIQIINRLLTAGLGTSGDYLQPVTERSLAQWFALYLVPYLTVEERRELRERLRPEISPSRWQNSKWPPQPTLAFRLAALVGLHAELQALVAGWRP